MTVICLAILALTLKARGAGGPEFNFENNSSGSFLFTGVYSKGIIWNMPLFDTLASAALNIGISPALFFAISNLGVCLLVFCAGCLLGGYWAGVVSLLAAGLVPTGFWGGFDIEQTVFSFYLLLVFALLLLRRGENTVKNNLLAGLAIGFSLLVRTPLFLFPPAVVFCDWLCGGGRSRGFALRSLVFLAAAYVLLIPWSAVRYGISGEFFVFDGRRAACNLITAARGSVYTMEGDCRKLAGIDYHASAFAFFVRKVAEDPGFYALTVIRRLWHIFLFNPVLFCLLLAALAACRDRERRTGFLLPAYFILIHSLLSVEKRYFYPLAYLIPPLAGGCLFPARFKGVPGAGIFAGKITRAFFWLSFCAVLAVQAVIIAYPYRSARNIENYKDFSLAVARFPGDRVIREMWCKQLLARGDYPVFYNCLGDYSKKFDDKPKAYLLRVLASTAPASIPLPYNFEMKCLIMRMLREFELGDQAAAGNSHKAARAIYEGNYNLIIGEPYRRDREIQGLIKREAGSFWDKYVYESLLLWPPGKIVKILSGVEKQAALTLRLRLLKELMADEGVAGRQLSEMISSEISGLPYGGSGRLWRESAKRSKKLSDKAVEQMRSGNFKAAERILAEATAVNSSNPEVLMNLCGLWLRQGKKELALEACQSAANSVYYNQGNWAPAFETLAGEASLESFKLLKDLGREADAKEALRRSVESFARARKAFKETE